MGHKGVPKCRKRSPGSTGQENRTKIRIYKILLHLPHETAGRLSSSERQAPILLPGQGPGPAPRLLSPSWRSLGGRRGEAKRVLVVPKVPTDCPSPGSWATGVRHVSLRDTDFVIDAINIEHTDRKKSMTFVSDRRPPLASACFGKADLMDTKWKD